MDLNGENHFLHVIPCHLKGITCRKWANRLKIYESEQIRAPGVSLPPPRGNTHVYYKNIQVSSSLKHLGQSKPNIQERGTNVFVNN